jgi:hypothetical protein
VSSVLAAAALAFGSLRAAAANVDFDVQNLTDHAIVGMWVSPSGMGTWGPGVRRAFVGAAGGSARINFDVGTEISHTCLYDFQVLFAGGQQNYWRNLDLCSMHGITINVVRGQVTGFTY